MLLAELIKLAVSLTVACYAEFKTAGESQSKPKLHAKGIAHLVCASVHDCVFSSGSWMLILPAGLYALQTHLVYIAVSNMDTVSFQVTYQLKILTTVLFSIIMLQRIITPRQRVALVLLTLGVAFVQVADTGPSSSSLSFPTSLFLVNLGDWLKQMGHQKNISTTTAPANVVAVPTSVFRITGSNMNSSKGFIAAITAAFISGFTGVYFEKLLKESKVSVSLWKRNAQLSCCSIFPIVILGVFWKDGTAIAEHGFFVGYGPIVWATIFLQALGGILVAICITYADNVIKNLAASFSIVVSYLANTVLFDEPMTLNQRQATSDSAPPDRQG
ncbi:UDP-galactose transporter Gms1 [Sporothrix epigloea]|uniref:UDP-galactose transporter Gms1 n=1 Tax=Sporothrix epigloea TaxID=1892477 RepID=A0ABP0DFK5_9PEZI